MTSTTKTILVIEGNAEMRAAIGWTLKAHGHAVITARDGREGLDLYYLRRPALIICDVMLPDRDGFQTIGALRDAGVRVPIIASAASEFYADNSALFLNIALAIGADAAIVTPPSGPELQRTVAGLLPAACES